jgi:peptidoglycan/xylan/chitin deacetylase (PgdA/CDA1 family)
MRDMFSLARRGLRVLMYHKISRSGGDELTVTVTQLERQMTWLRAEGWDFVTLNDVVTAVVARAPLPAWPILVTFDDAYVDTLELALPALQKCGVRAAVFVPSGHVGGTSSWERVPSPLMNGAQLRAMAEAGWEIALHSHLHRNFASLDAAQIASDVRQNISVLRDLGLAVAPALAYPFGRRPRDPAVRTAMQTALGEAGVQVAFRIGNRVNPLPLRDRFEVNRLGVRGDRSFGAFQRKLRWGRLL